MAYADDLLLASTTVTGLQSLIDLSVSQIEKCGLRFCMCYLKIHLLLVTGQCLFNVPDVTLFP